VPYIEDHNQCFSNSPTFISASDNNYSPLQNLNFEQNQSLLNSKTDSYLSQLSLPSTFDEGKIKCLIS